MGSYAKQHFIFGIGIGEEYYEKSIDEIEEFCEKHSLNYYFGGDQINNSENTGLVIGKRLSIKVTEEGYVGGYWVTPFDIETFNEWFTTVKDEISEETILEVQEFLNVKDNLKLWTVSQYS